MVKKEKKFLAWFSSHERSKYKKFIFVCFFGVFGHLKEIRASDFFFRQISCVFKDAESNDVTFEVPDTLEHSLIFPTIRLLRAFLRFFLAFFDFGDFQHLNHAFQRKVPGRVIFRELNGESNRLIKIGLALHKKVFLRRSPKVTFCKILIIFSVFV